MGRQKNGRAVIFCWSQSVRQPFGITSGDFIICADSGCEYALRCGVKPDIILGDFDSYAPGGGETAEIIALPKEKDDTDAMYAARFAVSRGFETIDIAGGVGGRQDHTQGAVAVLRYINRCCQGIISDGFTKIQLVPTGGVLRIGYDTNIGYISVFPRGRTTYGVTLRGMKYPLTDYTLTDEFPVGVSNEQSEGLDSVISCKKGGLTVYTLYR